MENILVKDKLKDFIVKIEHFIENESFDKFPENLKDAASYIMSLKGKRLRPIMTLLTAEGFGVPFEKAISAAVSMEMFHNFTLIHDDIMDEAHLRRGNPTVHEKFGVNKAIIAGDAMLPSAIDLLIRDNENKSNALLSSFLKMSKEVMEGQQFDMNFEIQEYVNLNQYMNMIRLKTSVLFGCACEVGAILGDANAENCQKLYDFGVHLGLAFQIMDDYLDTFGDEAFGKRIGGDILLNKKTFLMISALNKANPEQKRKIDELLTIKDEEIKISGFQQVFKEIDVDKMAQEKMQELSNIAISALSSSDISENGKEDLFSLSNYMLKRTV